MFVQSRTATGEKTMQHLSVMAAIGLPAFGILALMIGVTIVEMFRQ